MDLVSRFHALLFAIFLLLLIVKSHTVISYDGRETSQQSNVLRKRNNTDATSDKNENNGLGRSQEVVDVANSEGNTGVEKESSGSSTGDEDFDSSGILDVELPSGSGDVSSDSKIKKQNAEIKLNGKRLHSISEAITKLLNSGRKRLDVLKNGKYSDIKKKSLGPVVHAYVSDNHYDDSYENPILSKLYRKNVVHHRKHHRRPFYYSRRRPTSDLEFIGMPYNLYNELPTNYNEEDGKFPAYKKPMYLYYPEMLPNRYDEMPQGYPGGLAEGMQPEEMENAILSNYALQQEFAGKR